MVYKKSVEYPTMPYGRHFLLLSWIREMVLPRVKLYSKPDPDTGCLLWVGPKDTSARNHLGTMVPIQINRLLSIMRHGPEALDGKDIQFTCGNRACLFKGHLVFVTRAERMRALGSAPKSEATCQAISQGHLRRTALGLPGNRKGKKHSAATIAKMKRSQTSRFKTTEKPV